MVSFAVQRLSMRLSMQSRKWSGRRPSSEKSSELTEGICGQKSGAGNDRWTIVKSPLGDWLSGTHLNSSPITNNTTNAYNNLVTQPEPQTPINQHWFSLICVTSRSMSTYWSHYYIETKCPRNSKAPNPCEVIFCHRSEQLHDHGKVRPAKNYPKLHMTTPVACKLATVQTGKHGNRLVNVYWWTS